MATRRQRVAVDKLVENGGSVSAVMREVGYTPATAKTPKKLTESLGYKEILKEYGLTEGLITKSLVSDIEKKPKNRLGEMRLGAEILGMTKKEESTTQNIQVIIATQIQSKFDADRTDSKPSEDSREQV